MLHQQIMLYQHHQILWKLIEGFVKKLSETFWLSHKPVSLDEDYIDTNILACMLEVPIITPSLIEIYT